MTLGIMNWLSGKKTYLLVAAAIFYTLLKWFHNDISADMAMKELWSELTAGAIRHGVTTRN